MPTNTPDLVEPRSINKKKSEPEVPELKKRKQEFEDESGASKKTQDPLAELMNSLQDRVECINNEINQVIGFNAAVDLVDELVSNALSGDNSDKPTKSHKSSFNLSPMSDAVNTNSLLDTLDFDHASKLRKDKEPESLELESETHFTYS